MSGYASDDDFGGQGSGGQGGGFGARGPAGIGGGGGTGTDGMGTGGGAAGAGAAGSAASGGAGAGGAGTGCCPPGNCSPPGDPGGPGTSDPDSPPPDAVYDPIYLRFGAATENVTDLEIPGPIGRWQFSRSYNSKDGVRNAVTNQGWGWLNNQAERRLIDLNPGSGTFNVLGLLEGADSQLNFERPSTSDPYVNASGWTLTQNTTSHEYTVTNSRSGEVWIFYDFDTSNGNKKGRLKESTTQWWKGAGKTGSTYTYNATTGLLSQITTPQGQAYNVVFTPDSAGRISLIEVNKATTTIMKVEYTYFDVATHSSDVGTSGDLVQVKVSQLTSGGTDIIDASHRVERYTQYRYDPEHRLMAIFNHDGIYSLIEDNSNISSPEGILTKGNTYSAGSSSSRQIRHFADRMYSYKSTSSISYHTGYGNWRITAFAPAYGEELLFEYGGLYTNDMGMVEQGLDRPKGCTGCGGGGSTDGVKYDYYYMAYDHGSSPSKNDVVLMVIEDTSDSNGTPVKRRIWGINNSGNILREAVIKDPVGTPTFWCSSRKLTSSGRVAEYRLNSAHTDVTDNDALTKFLDPSTGTNDSDTLNDSTGFIYVYEYDASDRLTATKIKQGETGTAYYESYTEYDANAGVSLSYRDRTFPTKVSSSPTTSGVYTQYNYTYWDTDTKTRIKTREILPPIVDTSQNGSGVQTHLWEYYDEAGRLRWTKNGEGYVTYRAYSPITGSLTYQMRDVDTSSLGSEITDGDNSGAGGSDVKWEAWSGAVPSDLVRDTGLPSALALVTKQEFDDLGRVTRRIFPRGNQNYIRYDKDKTITFPYVNSSTGIPALPVVVTAWDDAHRNTEVYTVDPARTAATGVPTGFTSGTNQSHYVSWIRKRYDAITGALAAVDEYYNIPDSGYGSLGTNFYTSCFLYDGLGQSGAAIQYVESSKYQVATTLYNIHGRPIEVRRGVATVPPVDYSGSSPTQHYTYNDLDNDLSSTPTDFSGYAKVSEIEYDNGGVGDGYVTAEKRYFGTGANDCMRTVYYRSFRGDIRGMARQKHNGTTFVGIGPYQVADVDWLGRTTNEAVYTTEPNWSADIVTGDGLSNYISGHSTGRNNWTISSYDALSRIYRVESYPGIETTKHFETNDYFDRCENLVCTGDKYGAHAEFAYDGVGREYEIRTVLDVASTKYTSGIFNYHSPQPKPLIYGTGGDIVSGTDDQVIELSHTVFDASGNAIEQHKFECNHSDTDGIDLTNDDDYIRRTVFRWYDSADRLTTKADYGSGSGGSTPATWTYTAVVARPSELTWTDSIVYDGYVLLAKVGYNASTSGLETVASGVRKNGSDTTRSTTKAFYDDLGRRTYVAENFVDFDPATLSTIGGGTSNDQDRVTKWTYNGLSRVLTLTAYNNSSSNAEITEYQYATDTTNYDASLVTLTKYPDGSTSGTDNVQMTYHLDRWPKTRTDQRGIKLTYVYDDARRLKRQEASATSGTVASKGVDDSTLSIGRTYDTMGRVVTVSSNSAADGSGTVQNEIKYTYHSTLGYLQKTEQSHQSAVGGGTPAVQYAHDDSAMSNVFDDGLRLENVTYPGGPGGGRVIFNGYGSSNGIGDLLGRVQEIRETNSGGTQLVNYEYNGTSRLVRTAYPSPVSVEQRNYHLSGQGVNNYNGFDCFGRMKDLWWWGYSTNTARDAFLYTYDYAGNRLTRDIPTSVYATNNLDQAYTYDGLHRLLNYDQGTLSSGSITSSNQQRYWELDQLGNWAKLRQGLTGSSTVLEDRTHNAVNELTGFTTPTTTNDPTYDDAGNLTLCDLPENLANGNEYPFQFTYDAWNRLIKTDDEEGHPIAYEYDGLGRRIYYNGYGNIRHFYYNEQWQLLEARVGASTNPREQFVWHPYYVDALAVRYYDANSDGSYGGTNEGAQFYCQDANFNVTSVLKADGTVIERYSYSPYGQVTFLNASFGGGGANTIGNTHLYTGRERDGLTGLQLNRHRYYASYLGRWLTRDPIRYDGGGYNLYAYVGGMPTRHVDPTGEIIPIIVAGGVIGGWLLWPDPANAPAPGDPTYPDTDAGLPCGVMAGASAAASARCACRALGGSGGAGAGTGAGAAAEAVDEALDEGGSIFDGEFDEPGWDGWPNPKEPWQL